MTQALLTLQPSWWVMLGKLAHLSELQLSSLGKELDERRQLILLESLLVGAEIFLLFPNVLQMPRGVVCTESVLLVCWMNSFLPEWQKIQKPFSKLPLQVSSRSQRVSLHWNVLIAVLTVRWPQGFVYHAWQKPSGTVTGLNALWTFTSSEVFIDSNGSRCKYLKLQPSRVFFILLFTKQDILWM